MTTLQNRDRIRTTHVGSLPRPARLLDAMKAKFDGVPIDGSGYAQRVREAVRDMVQRQIATGIDIVTDGEMSKSGFFAYVAERLSGFEPRPDRKFKLFAAEIAAFPEYYEQYFRQAMLGGAVTPVVPLACVGPVTYQGIAALQADLANLRAALAEHPQVEAFVPATAPSGVGFNEYYRSEEEYLFAVADAMQTEYLAIVDAGFSLQIDDPFIVDVFCDPELDAEMQRRRADLYVEVINHGLRGIPAERVRFHTCFGINHGPRIHEAAMADVIEHMLRVNASAYSFEGANPRHEHEYRLWDDHKLPAGKVLIPGVITHASNIVEHPELIAERLLRYAQRVGRENVIAGADCGFSSQACYHPEIDPKVVWAKFEALRDGARLASAALW